MPSSFSHPRIDVFVSIIDNLGDMGTTCELIIGLEKVLNSRYEFIIWTDVPGVFHEFLMNIGLNDRWKIYHIQEFVGLTLKTSSLGISILHSQIPDLTFFAPRALILRIDYLSFDSTWVVHNEKEHISSNYHQTVIELIPSPLSGGAGLLPQDTFSRSSSFSMTPHYTFFLYPNTFFAFDWTTFPTDKTLFIFGCPPIDIGIDTIVFSDILPLDEFYAIMDTSELVVTRGDTSGAHMIASGNPFFWDMYRDLGGFPSIMSQGFLKYISASSEYCDIHTRLNNQKNGKKITYLELISALASTPFPHRKIPNLLDTIKKHIDRFQKSI